MKSEPDPSWEVFAKAALGRKAVDLVALDVHDLTSVADVFIVCSGRSNRQVTAIADFILRDLKRQGLRALHVEGKKEGHWVLLDYGHVVVHVFYEPVRQFYDLEGLWADALRIRSPVIDAARAADPDRTADGIIEETID